MHVYVAGKKLAKKFPKGKFRNGSLEICNLYALSDPNIIGKYKIFKNSSEF